MKVKATVLAVFISLGVAAVAHADGTSTGPTYTTKVVDVVGRRVQPVAAVEVTRALPSLKLHELRPSFVVGVEASVAQGPF